LPLRYPTHYRTIHRFDFRSALEGASIGGLILAADTGPGHLFPDDSAYTTAALVGAMAITTLTSLALVRRRSSETNP
jgi:hypothetical protein